MKAVIFAGGVGTRLWPLSRKSSPKQFEKVIGNKSTIQLTVERLVPSFGWDKIYIATGKQYVNIVKKQLPKMLVSNIIGEPQMRDVGPAVGLITAILYRQSPKTPFAILWSDHLVKKEELFRLILLKAEKYIENNLHKIIFIGQKPRFASQNLGWIEYYDKPINLDGVLLYPFKSFRYRPDLKLAQQFYQSGHHAWNLGYFVTSAEYLWKQYKKYAPQMYQDLKIIQNAWGTKSFTALLNEIYPRLEKISFDNLILEKIDPKDAFVISENVGWSDVGAWEALKEALQKDPSENVTHGKVLTSDSEDTLIFNYSDQLVVGIDLKNMLVINTGDVVLVCPKNSVPKIKKLVENMAGTEHEHLT